MLKLAKTLLPLSWMCLIFVLSDIPYELVPIETTSAQQLLAHIILYGVLAYLIILAVQGWQINVRRWKLNFFVIAFSIFYGITDEYHQGFVMGRFVSFADLGFNAVGAVLAIFCYWFINKKRKPKLLLHICCVGCGAYVSQLLKRDFDVTLYFYNPNIYPETEYNKRLAETERVAKKFNPARAGLIIGEYNHDRWLKLIKGYEKEPEKGKRCLICYGDRLKSAVKVAKDPAKNGTGKKFNYFTSTLTISPHKDAQAISQIGNDLANRYGVDPLTGAQDLSFLDRDFKKQDGFKKSVELSKELGLYRQGYCGCEYSGNL